MTPATSAGPVTTTAIVDTTAPSTPTTTIPTSSNTTTPTLSGTGDPGSTIDVVIDPDGDPTTDNSFTLTTTVDGGGNWSVTVPPGDALPDGTTATVSVTATDPSGNTSPAVTENLLIDTSAPDAPQLRIPNVIHTATPTFTGTAEPGSTIELTIDPDNNPATLDSFTLTTTVNPDGTWSVTVPGGNALTDGNDISISVVAIDEAGNTSVTTTGTSTVNTTPPSAPSISITPTSGLTTTESGGTASFDVVLTNRPTADVTITFSLDTTEGSLSTNTVTFTAANWDTPQTVTVTGVNDPEVDGDITYTITATAVSNDPYHNNLAIPSVTVTNVDDDGPPVITSDGGGDTASISLAENQTVVTTVTAVDTDVPVQTLTYSIIGGTDQSKFSIDGVTGELTFTTAPDFENPTDTNTDNQYEVMVAVDDGTGSSDSQTITVTITDANEAGVGAISDTDATTDSVMENASVGTAVGITANATDPDGTDTVTYSLDDNAGGRFAIDANTGVVTVASGIDREAAGSYDITVRATSTDTSTTTRLFTVNIGDVDEFDVGAVADVDGTANSVDENAVAGSVVGITVDASDSDATNNAITFSLVDDDGGRFQIDSTTGVVSTLGTIDREADGATRIITVRATSADGSFSDQAFTININDVDEFDVGAIIDSDATANSVAENAVIGTTVGLTAQASDADATTSAIAYTLDDNAGGRFAIDNVTGVVTVNAALDYETNTSHNVTVRATSADGSFSTQSFTIDVTDVSESGVTGIVDNDAAADFTLENAAIGSAVGVTAFADDADGTDTVSYSLDNDAGGRFSIDSVTGVVTVASGIDREAAGSYDITVRATSTDTSTTTRLFTINIGDVDEFDVGAVADVDGTANSVDENAAAGSVVGITAAASDTDATNNAITYSLVDDDGGRFQIDSTTGVVTTLGAIDREVDGATRNITVRATSADGSFSDQAFAISINDVDEFDVGAIIDGDATANSVAENAVIGTTVGLTAQASDADATTSAISYTLDDNAGGRFAIDNVTGVVTVNAALDYETNSSHNVTVRATSADGSFSTQSFAIDVTDVSESGVTAIVDNDAAADFTLENAAVGSAVGVTAFADDADGTDTVSYSLDSDAGGRFAIDSVTGVVTVASGIDREAAGSYDITVRATSTDTSTTTRLFTINIGDVDEFDVGAVADVDGTANSVDENAAAGSVVGITAAASDTDATNNAIAYSLVDDDGGRFQIDSTTGVVTTLGAIDREADGATRNITVRATSADGSFSDQAFAISINDVDEFDVGAIIDSDATANSVAENAVIGTTVGLTAQASDADATTSAISYTLDDNAGGRFAIDNVTGVVSVNAALDYETNTSHNVTVRATSDDGSFSTQSFTIDVTDVSESGVTAIVDNDAAADFTPGECGRWLCRWRHGLCRRCGWHGHGQLLPGQRRGRSILDRFSDRRRHRRQRHRPRSRRFVRHHGASDFHRHQHDDTPVHNQHWRCGRVRCWGGCGRRRHGQLRG